MKRWFVLLALVILLPPTIFWWMAERADQRGGGSDGSTRSPLEQRLAVHRVALAAMDNLKVSEARPAWDVLFETTPDDTSVALNRALNLVLFVDELATTAGDASAKPEEKTEARRQLPDLIAAARQAIQDYQNAHGDSFLATWMATRIDLREASLLPASMTKSIRRDVFQRLVQQIDALTRDTGRGDRLILLAGPMTTLIDVLEDPIKGFPKELLDPAATAMVKLSDLRPNNLYLALRAAQLSLANRSEQAIESIRRTASLAKAIEPTLARQTAAIGKTPQTLIDEIVASVEGGEFEAAENQMLLWFNLLNSTELIKADRRRASPHPLDLVSFESLSRIAGELSNASPIDDALQPIVLDTQSISGADLNNEIVAMTAIDADLDFDEDLVCLSQGPENQSLLQLFLWDATSKQFEASASLQLDGVWNSMMTADLFVVDSSSAGRIRQSTASNQHNTIQSLIVYGDGGVKLIAVDPRSSANADDKPADTSDSMTLSVITEETGLESLSNVTAMTAGDLEGDGDLDLIVATQTGLAMMVNRGNRTFFALAPEVLQATSWEADDPPVDLAIADLDRDLDLDVVTVHSRSGKTGLIENLLHLQFRFKYLDEIPTIAGADSIAVEDLDGNVSWDLVVSSPEQAKIVQTKTVDVGQWKVVRTKSLEWKKAIPKKASSTQSDVPLAAHTIVADLDNDGFFEAIRRVPGGLACFSLDVVLNGFDKVVPQAIQIDDVITPWLVADFDDDRVLDLAGVGGTASASRTAHAAMNRTPDVGQAIEIRFKGIDDNNANSGRVNHYAVGSVLELRFGPYYRSRIITEPSTHIGIDGITADPNLRVIFPNGLTQTVADVSPGVLLEEEQTLKGSCPYLYAFNGERFEFVTDCLWAAPLGLQVSPGVVVPDRPWEHLKIDGDYLSPHDGAYDLRITEELWEVAYFDELKLTAVDHPVDIEIHTNEKVGPASIASPKIHAFKIDELTAVASIDTSGRDVTETLREIDGEHVQGFDRRYRQGLCPPHWIELDLSDRIASHVANGKLADDVEIKLVLTGWILPTDTSLNIQIDQNPELPSPEPPSLLVPDEAGRWRVADPFIGFPGGKNKTIVVDITPHVNVDDGRVRVRTTNQIYWDAARVSVRTKAEASEVDSTVRNTPLPLLSAEVAWHGFSRRIHPGDRQAESYDYESADDQPRWPPLTGALTTVGPVESLLEEWDDRMVVISGGDEIRLRFEAVQDDEPERDSVRRDFILYGVGWDKDADLNTLAGQSTMPLPAREMASYPPTATDWKASDDVRRSNGSHLRRRQPFRSFWKPIGY
ncbi:FG-GAP-like repeat-containing protein [Neorhodopirellula pilleata]|uniref:FG-GAP repeat protein n=1 Tax=Neorhodopirellula pilleata TaxID=2714738 RepID=A0A5C6A7Q4_9BACT|nr:FG-GAP-like repeat-containing protein [Neorhodopirellula pilleata]TWT95111.1 hypothetical protein Pla100_36930 [Neorhodopirellula pilleata]